MSFEVKKEGNTQSYNIINKFISLILLPEISNLVEQYCREYTWLDEFKTKKRNIQYVHITYTSGCHQILEIYNKDGKNVLLEYNIKYRENDYPISKRQVKLIITYYNPTYQSYLYGYDERGNGQWSYIYISNLN